MVTQSIIAIDPGTRGAYCIMGLDGVIWEADNFPLIEKIVKNHRKGQKATRKDSSLDLPKIFDRFRRGAWNMVGYMELVHSRPHEGVASSFKFGLVRGQIEGIFTAMEIPFITVSPREWQKNIHSPKDIFDKVDAKTRSKNAYLKCIDPFGDRVHDGVIDATLIALYGQRRLTSGLDNWRFK